MARVDLLLLQPGGILLGSHAGRCCVDCCSRLDNHVRWPMSDSWSLDTGTRIVCKIVEGLPWTQKPSGSCAHSTEATPILLHTVHRSHGASCTHADGGCRNSQDPGRPPALAAGPVAGANPRLRSGRRLASMGGDATRTHSSRLSAALPSSTALDTLYDYILAQLATSGIAGGLRATLERLCRTARLQDDALPLGLLPMWSYLAAGGHPWTRVAGNSRFHCCPRRPRQHGGDVGRGRGDTLLHSPGGIGQRSAARRCEARSTGDDVRRARSCLDRCGRWPGFPGARAVVNPGEDGPFRPAGAGGAAGAPGGGRLDVRSQPGEGTQVQAWLPIEEPR